MKISVVVPAYNEAKRIGLVLDGLKGLRLPVVVVDDGSRDQTFEVASQYPATVLRHRVNLGKGAALKTGCEAAFRLGSDAVIMMDADGQHKIEDLTKFISILKSGTYDIIFGARELSRGTPLVRRLGNKFASFLISFLFGIYVSDLLCGYRALSKKAYKKINLGSMGYGVETEMVVESGRAGLKHCEVPVETVYYDKFKGVTIIDAFGVFINVLRWRINK